jgi:hypothetical protein
MIAALNSWVLAFDNMSEIKQSLSDAMCRLATGGGFACRKLYTDIDETLIDAMRPQMTDGIEEYASKQDYLDRSLLVMPQPIPESQRKPEAELWAEFARVHPRILGALLDAVVCALRRRSAITFERLPRMADFAIWVTAAEEALGWPQGTFLAAYTENRAQADMVALQASVIAGPVWLFAHHHWLLRQKPWVGTATKLLAELEKGVDETTQAQRSRNGWPRAPHILSGALKRIAPSLRKCGLDVTFDHTKTSRLITLTYTAPPDRPTGTDADMPPWESPALGADSDQGGQVRETGLQNSVSSVTSVTDQSLEAPGEASPEGLKRHPDALFDAWGDAGDAGDACLRDRFPQGGAAPECGQARPEQGPRWEAEL